MRATRRGWQGASAERDAWVSRWLQEGQEAAQGGPVSRVSGAERLSRSSALNPLGRRSQPTGRQPTTRAAHLWGVVPK